MRCDSAVPARNDAGRATVTHLRRKARDMLPARGWYQNSPFQKLLQSVAQLAGIEIHTDIRGAEPGQQHQSQVAVLNLLIKLHQLEHSSGIETGCRGRE